MAARKRRHHRRQGQTEDDLHISRCSFYPGPHHCELSIRNNCSHIELNPIALYPWTEMGPNLADITCLSNRHATTADWLTNAIFQFKSLEFVSQCT